MSTIAAIEDAMLAALREKLPGLEVATLPGPPEEALRRTMRMPAVWVLYGGAEFSANSAMAGYMIQEIRYTFYVICVNKNLRSVQAGQRGTYEIVELVREALSGLCTPGGRTEVVSEQIRDFEAGAFVYLTTVRVTGRFEKKL